MAKPLPVSDSLRGVNNGPPARSTTDRRAPIRESSAEDASGYAQGSEEVAEMERLREENVQLRALCLELEQALQEAATAGGESAAKVPSPDGELEVLLEEKSEAIRQLHQHIEELQAALAEAESRIAEAAELAESEQRNPSGPAPREEELLALSEELERERRQLQEDEQTLMDQMREMEVGMARERAEMARQRNDLQRLQAEVRHELERLERNGALQSKIDNLKTKLQDVTARRGAARVDAAPGPAGTPPVPGTPPQPSPPGAPAKGQGLMGRLFGNGGR